MLSYQCKSSYEQTLRYEDNNPENLVILKILVQIICVYRDSELKGTMNCPMTKAFPTYSDFFLVFEMVACYYITNVHHQDNKRIEGNSIREDGFGRKRVY